MSLKVFTVVIHSIAPHVSVLTWDFERRGQDT